MSIENQTQHAISVIQSGGIIVYPTESIYGLGCNPFKEEAVLNLLSLKKRSVKKGLILIASHVQQILPLIQPIVANDLARALKTWPGHHTWIFPKSSLTPTWVSGSFDTIAVRVSSHPIVKVLCDKLDLPLVSTSANLTNHTALKSINEIKIQFGDKIDAYINAPLGNQAKASKMTVAHSSKQLR